MLFYSIGFRLLYRTSSEMLVSNYRYQLLFSLTVLTPEGKNTLLPGLVSARGVTVSRLAWDHDWMTRFTICSDLYSAWESAGPRDMVTVE